MSAQELRHLLSFFPEIDGRRILFTPNFASRREYEAVLSMFESSERLALVSSGTINQAIPFLVIDNTTMLQRWGNTIFKNRSVFLRVDPAEDGHGHHAHVYTGSASKFGIMPDEIRSDAFQAVLRSEGITVIGLHMHKGSGISNASEWARSAQSLLALLPVFPSLEIVDIGGGLGVPYRPTSSQFDLSTLDEQLGHVVSQYPNISFVAEPGRFVAAECGVLLAKVTQTKEKNARRFVGISCGMNALIRPALYESYHHVVNISRFDEKYLREATPDAAEIAFAASPSFLSCKGETDKSELALMADIVGPICETGDFIGKDRIVPADTQEDDVVLIDTVGAYGRVMACNYNMRPIGPDVYIEEDGSFQIIEPTLNF